MGARISDCSEGSVSATYASIQAKISVALDPGESAFEFGDEKIYLESPCKCWYTGGRGKATYLHEYCIGIEVVGVSSESLVGRMSSPLVQGLVGNGAASGLRMS